MYVRTGGHSGGMAAGRVSMYAAKERKTLVIETAHILSFGLFLCPQAFEKSVCGHRLQEEVDTEQLHADGLTMGKGADILPWSAEVTAVTAYPLGRALGEPTALCSQYG